jgi:rSAM/selenodomain-associated transferase 1
METETRVLIFAKAPLPGTVKTRLISLLGAEGAADLQRRLVDHTLAVAAASAVGPLELWCAPDCDDPFLRDRAKSFAASLQTQAGGDLGARMLHAFECALRTSPCAVLIGTDCPVLGPEHIREAVRVLARDEAAVFCPAEDGGYALIGLARCDASLFHGISWSGPSVMADTRMRLRQLGWRWRELATLWDIDRPEDYRRLRSSGLLNGHLA